MRFLFLIWLLLTFVAAISIIGAMCLFISGTNSKSTWMELGETLLDNCKKK